MYGQFDRKFERHQLDEEHEVYTGRVPDELATSPELFQRLWAMRPDVPQMVMAPYQGFVEIPRRQAAYGADYPFAGQVMHAVPTPPLLMPYRDWVRQAIDPRMNGQLINWYDGPGEYIGKHNDAKNVLFQGSPIVTITLGEERKFRMRPNEGNGYLDLPFPSGTFIMIPFQTNQRWKHEVPKSKKYSGRRISITIRAFTVGVVDPQ